MSDHWTDPLQDEWFHSDDDTLCRFPGWCVMGASMHLSHECVHVDDAAHYYEMIEQEFSSTEEIGGEA